MKFSNLLKSKRFIAVSVSVCVLFTICAANSSAAPEDETEGFLDPFTLQVTSYSSIDSNVFGVEPTTTQSMLESAVTVTETTTTEPAVITVKMPRPTIVPYRPRPRSPIRF